MRAILLALGLTIIAAAAAAQARLPVEAYGRLPAIADVAISPDGTKVALAVSAPDGTQAIRVIDLASGQNVWGSRISDSGIEAERPILRTVGWADDTHVTYLLSATFRTNRITPYYVEFTGNPSRIDRRIRGIANLTTGQQYYISVNREYDWILPNDMLSAPIEGDPGGGRLVTFNTPYADQRLGVYRVDLDNGRARLLHPGETDTVQFQLNERGEPVARLDFDDRAKTWRILRLGAGVSTVVAQGATIDGQITNITGQLANGDLVMRNLTEDGRKVLAAYGADGALPRMLYEHPRYDVMSAIRDPWTRHVVGAAIVEDFVVQRFSEPDLAAALTQLTTRHPQASVQLLTWSRDRSKIIVDIEDNVDAGGFYVFEPATSRLRLLGMRYPDITGDHVGVRQAITYPARDRVRIPAYLTLPAGAEPRNLPLVVLVHGGPSARDTFDFDWWASFLASRGYAVVQPNYRGSSGYGDAWERAGYGQWGQLMQTDVEDAVASLAHNGIADPQRVCIVGASYGGYAALAGATLTPDRYKCAIAVAGVSDLPLMMSRVEGATGRSSSSTEWWSALIGDRRGDAERIRAVSPYYQAANATAPILLIHGANDVVVPIEQSRRMAAALRSAGKEVRLVEFPGEDHWLSDAPTRIQMLRETETFLAQHLAAPP